MTDGNNCVLGMKYWFAVRKFGKFSRRMLVSAQTEEMARKIAYVPVDTDEEYICELTPGFTDYQTVLVEDLI